QVFDSVRAGAGAMRAGRLGAFAARIGPRRIPLIAPRPRPRISPARSHLPLLLRRQSLAGPLGVRLSIAIADIHDRVVFLSLRRFPSDKMLQEIGGLF